MSILLGMKQKITKIMTSLMLTIAMIPSAKTTVIHAEDYSDTDAWNERCQSENITTVDDYNACKAYTEYIASQTPDLQKQLEDINAQKTSIEADISAYQTQLDQYQSSVDSLNSSIGDLEAQAQAIQTKIDDAQTQIETKQKEIDADQASIQAISDKIKQRMVNSQKNLRVNSTFDVLMGAKTFNDFLRIAGGLSSITQKEREENDQLVTAMDTIHTAQQALQDTKDQLASDQQDLKDQEAKIEDQKAEVLVAQYKVQVIQEAAQAQEAVLAAQGDHVASNISDVQSTMSSISSSLDALQAEIFKPTPTVDPSSDDSGNDSGNNSGSDTNNSGSVDASGWARPVYGSSRSAGTWTYPGGSPHLGYDFAVPLETRLYAAGSGVILNSVNGCGYGTLGSDCGGAQGGGYGGGNQIYLLCVVNNTLYGVIYDHMTLNSPIARGTIVNAGDYVGLSGSSGNSSGPHCHIEVMKLGDGSNFANYAKTYNGDIFFGCGWANGPYGTYGRRCQDGVGVPCRIRPEDIWGY